MVLSLCAALGLHWAALQSVAWAGMLVNFSRTGSVAEAVAKTFDGQHPCPLCMALSKSEQGSKKQEFQAARKLDMDCQRKVAMVMPGPGSIRWPEFIARGAAMSREPDAPPPRAA
jgi:hypothetical protein